MSSLLLNTGLFGWFNHTRISNYLGKRMLDLADQSNKGFDTL